METEDKTYQASFYWNWVKVIEEDWHDMKETAQR